MNSPQTPQIMTALQSEIYSAFRVSVAPDYAYTSSECGVQSSECQQNVIDLAVTSSMQGKIHTVDVTDPYNPQVMGVTKGSDGNEVTIIVADLVISKVSGMVFATAGNSVYIIDVKDPHNPRGALGDVVKAPG